MKKTAFLILLFLSVFLAGCSANEDIAEIKEQNRTLKAENQILKEQYESLKTQLSNNSISSISTNTESIKSNLEIGEFYKLPGFETTHFVGIKTTNGELKFEIPSEAKNINLSKNKVEFAISNEWLQVDHVYEFMPNISNAPECEIEIKKITNKLPPITLKTEDLKSFLDYSAIVPDVLMRTLSTLIERTEGKINIDELWLLEIGSDGASYFYESSNDYVSNSTFKIILAESLNHFDGVTIHEKVEVKKFDFKNYFGALETTIEKKRAEENYEDMFSAIYHVPQTFIQKFHNVNSIFPFTSSVDLLVNCFR